MKIRGILLITCLCLLSVQATAQRWVRERNHLVIGFAATNFMGDLGGSNDIGTQGPKDFDLKSVRPGLTLGYRYHLQEFLALKGTVALGYIYSDDFFTGQQHRNNRNIHFRSPIFELSGQGEYYFWELDMMGDRYRKITGSPGWIGFRLKLYLFAGIGGFYYEPQGQFIAADFDRGNFTENIPEPLPPDGWYDLRPLRTEGQGHFDTRDRYTPIGLTFPFGLGATFSLSPEMDITFEYGFRKTFTDYIDDVSTTYIDPDVFNEMFGEDTMEAFLGQYFSNPTLDYDDPQTTPGYQRANPHNDDAYMFLFVTMSYKFQKARKSGRIPGL